MGNSCNTYQLNHNTNSTNGANSTITSQVYSALSLWNPAHLQVKNRSGHSRALLTQTKEYYWNLKKDLGNGGFERFFFSNLSFTRLSCQLTEQLSLENECSTDQFGFHIILRGKSDYEFFEMNKKVTLQPPQVWIQNGSLGKFRITLPANQTLKKISIFLDKAYLNELYAYHPNNQLLKCLTANNNAIFQPLRHVPNKIFELTNELLALPCSSDKLAQVNLQGQCLTLASILLSDTLNNTTLESCDKTAARLAAIKVKIYIEENPASSKTINELARFSGTNACYLKYEFKQLTGVTIHQYRLKIRMQQALQMLSDNQTSVHIIAAQLGFGSTDYFIKVFKSYFGHHPKMFR